MRLPDKIWAGSFFLTILGISCKNLSILVNIQLMVYLGQYFLGKKCKKNICFLKVEAKNMKFSFKLKSV